MTPLLRFDDRSYYARQDDDEAISGSEIVYLREWDELPGRSKLRSRFREVFRDAVIDDDALAVALTLHIGSKAVASIDVFVNDDGLEFGGFVRGDYESYIIADLEKSLGVGS